MAEVTIEATLNGPYLVTGTVELRDTDGRVLPTKGKVWLCRCGASTKKPLCDGTRLSGGGTGRARLGRRELTVGGAAVTDLREVFHGAVPYADTPARSSKALYNGKLLLEVALIFSNWRIIILPLWT